MPTMSKRAVQEQEHTKSKSSSKRVALATPASTPTGPALGAAGRVDSPDSVFFDSNIGSSHLSSASGSAGRCSFGSDHPDSLVLSERSAGRDRDGDVHESSSCNPDVDQSRSSTQCKLDAVHRNKQEYVQESTEEEEDTKPAKVSFSHALKARQNRRLHKNTDPVPSKKHDRRRPVSFDLNYPVIDAASSSSPRYPAMKKASANPRRSSGTFPSPGTPNYGGGVGLQKGWSSERVPLPASSGRRYAHYAPLPLNNGRNLPSKWEDAEKWIFSPVAGEGGSRASAAPPPHRRPKSKSGPLGAPGYAYYASSSPLMMPAYDGGRVGGFMASSPFSAGVLGVDAVAAGQGLCLGGNGVVGHYVGAAEPCIARSASVHGWSEVATQASVPSCQEENGHGTRDAATMIPPVVTRRDMATQMSPEGSAQSSPKEKPCESPMSSIPPIAELPAQSWSSKLEIRDVEVDDCITLSQWSMKSDSSGGVDKGLTSLGEWRKKAVEDRASAWDITETSKSVSKFRREEAKITAWENLQKAKAEAEIRKLEMKLEKIRTSSMDKIMNKLRSAQRKAQEMRSSATASEAWKVTKTSDKILSFRKGGRIGSLSGCFTCHAF